MEISLKGRKTAREAVGVKEETYEIDELMKEYSESMLKAAEALEFEKAAAFRDSVNKLKKLKAESEKNGGGVGTKVKKSAVESDGKGGGGRGGAKKGQAGMPGVRVAKRGGKKRGGSGA